MDLLGIFIAIIGAVTVVLSSNTSDVRLDPEALVYTISQQPFIMFSCVYVAAAATLAALSEMGMGKNWVFVDVGLCALFGTSPFPPCLGDENDQSFYVERWIHCIID
jgi:hypothetical protein